MGAVVIGGAVGIAGVYRIIGPAEVHIARPGVMRKELKSLREALFHFDLQRVVIIAGVTAKVAYALRPAELPEVSLALISGKRTEADQSGLIRIIVATGSSKHVRSFVADVCR